MLGWRWAQLEYMKMTSWYAHLYLSPKPCTCAGESSHSLNGCTVDMLMLREPACRLSPDNGAQFLLKNSPIHAEVPSQGIPGGLHTVPVTMSCNGIIVM